MKKCKDCNVEMIECSSLHTNYVGGVKFEEQIFLDYEDEKNGINMLFNNKKMSKKRVKARVCLSCGLVELYVDLNSNENI